MNSKNLTIPLFFSMLTFAACGGGGGGGGANAPIPSASLSSLTADRLTAPADGASEVLLTAVVRDTVGGALAGRQVQFQTIGAGAVLDPANAVSLSGGIATAKLRSNVAGPITVNAVVSPAGDAVRLDTTLTITFVAPDAPVVAGPARFEDLAADGVAGAGDRVVVPFSTAVVVNGAVAADFVLPTQDDSFGTGATVAAGPAANEVSITLGAGARLRTRGRFDPARVTSNEPSGIDVQNGAGIASAAEGTPAAASAAVDIAAGSVRQDQSVGGQLVAVGDLNSDFEPDLVVVDGTSFTPLVRDGASYTANTPAAGTAPTAVQIVNLNRIGNAEMVSGDAVGVRIWNSTAAVGGLVSLAESGFVATGAANGLDVCDVNTDGFPDIVTATSVGVIVAIHQRNLGNTYAIEQNLFLPNAVQDVVAVDLDGDGDPDVLALQAGGVKVLRNDGGTLVDVLDLPATGGERLSTGDTNGDGRPDVLFSGQGTATLFVQQPDGTFVGQAVAAVAAQKAELVDLDGDSFADIAATTATGVSYLQNDRAGGFESIGEQDVAGLEDLRTADLDRDGDNDAVAVGTVGLRLFLGSLQGTFGDATLVESQQLTDTAIGKQALADLNGDGFTDRVVSIANAAQVWFGDGDGNFTVGTSFGPSGTISAIALGDMDNDGDVDAVLGYDDGVAANEVWVNDGSGAFSFARAFSTGSITRSFGLTDFDQDGLLDVFVGNDGDNEVYVNALSGGLPLLTIEADAFLGLQPQVVGNETIAVLVFDFDREGDEDIIVVNGGDLVAPQDAYVLRRSGSGYTLLNTLNAQLLATAATIADVDGDGREDLAIAQLSSNGSASVKWFRGFNTSISTLSTNVATNGQYFSRSLIVADIDGDGRSDFVVGDVSVSNQPIAVLVQQPDGSFQVGQEFPTTRLEQIGAGDFDRDGDVDLVTVETTGPSRVIANR